MDRQLIIRGAAVSVAAIAASVFLAGQFLGDKQTLAGGMITETPDEVRGASVVNSFGSADKVDEIAPELEFSALDRSTAPATVPSVQDGFQPELTFADATPATETPLCDASLTAAPAIDGLIEIRLSAPCSANERVVISHADLAFTATLDNAGVFAAYIPALAETAAVDAFMSDDTLLQAQTQVPDFDLYARMVVQWTGPDAVALHAYHRGADYGEPGHIHALNPFDPELEDAFLVALGDSTALEPLLAQVYSVPLAQASTSRMQLELAVTDATCGKDMTAFILPTHGPDAGTSQEVSVAMPDCANGAGFVLMDLPFDTATPPPADVLLSLDAPQETDAPELVISDPSPES
ncbi:MAG: hypothetical protein HLUCCA05_05480 [Roseibaca calidilacus]|uniref:Uncharacterized protein n=1 Tax=Roseibaca calidilacus TaxID=1666912 RepID=A0A0P7YPS1_9RHOB|nr:hypothetical protein [Roseibaca calidilacus]KPP90866.1 MAG: hypothetical protein HLUCCA05_05480 [Roseibaca calidilacus]CUX83702.1 hypothetical protein Ga0058931_3136 [Roseibaca calidilacus]